MGATSKGIRAAVVRRGLLRTRVGGRARHITAIVRITAGVIFVLFGVVKFVVPELELAEFVRFGLPESVAIVYLVGLLEIVGGLMLVLGLLTRVAAPRSLSTWPAPCSPRDSRWAGQSTLDSRRPCSWRCST